MAGMSNSPSVERIMTDLLVTCPSCFGTGKVPDEVMKHELRAYGFMTCPSCNGKGECRPMFITQEQRDAARWRMARKTRRMDLRDEEEIDAKLSSHAAKKPE